MTSLKNHVSPKGKRLGQVLKNKFSVTLDDFDSAIMGDVGAAQRIGELARQGSLSSQYAPKIAAMYLQIIEGSEAYNKAIADILQQAGKSAIVIDKSVSQTLLANTKYDHQRKELAQEFIYSRNTENTRHDYQLNFTQIKGYVDAHLVGVDNQSAVLQQSYRPEIKQISADEQFQNRQVNEALEKGDKARYDLIVEKNYINGFKDKLLALKAAIGF